MSRRPENPGSGIAASRPWYTGLSPQSWTALAFPIGLMFLTFAAYLPAVNSGFIWDDDAYVTSNKTLESLDGLRRIWFEIGATDQYYPLVFSTFWIERHIWGLSAVGFHVVNILLHGISACLLWTVLRRLAVPGAGLAALIFAVHPVHVESVAWITERKNVLSGVFYLAAALCYSNFAGLVSTDHAERHRRISYFVALLFFVGALLSKTVTASFSVAILILIWWKRGRLRIADVTPLLPFLAFGISAGLLTAWIEHHYVGAGQIDWQLSLIDRFLIAGRAICFYFTKLVLPINLTFIYPRWQVEASDVAQFCYPVVVLTVIAVLYIVRNRIGRGPACAGFFFIGTLFPALGFVDVYPMRFSFVADHFQYLASMGPIVLVASVAAMKVRSAARLSAGSVIVCAILASLTFRQSFIYRDQFTLWTDTLRKNPDCWMAHGNLASEFARVGKYDEAIEHYSEGLRLYPDAPRVERQLADTLVLAGKSADAVEHYRKALEMAPDDSLTRTNLGTTLCSLGKYAEAAQAHRRVIELVPDDAEAHHNLGVALKLSGDENGAIAEFEAALRLNSNIAAAHMQLGNLLYAKNLDDKALGHYLAAGNAEPGNFSAHYNAACLLLKKKDAIGAAREFETALQIDPTHAQARQGLAAAGELARSRRP